jgi:hypothetical protein
VDGPAGAMGWDMFKLGAAVLVASFVAGLAVTAPGVTPPVEAHTYAIKGERLEVRSYGPACSERGWPYFEISCLRDTNAPTHGARKVRMVGSDRVPAAR